MSDKSLHELALLRFSLIAPVVNDTFNACSQMQFFRDMAAKTHILPDGRSVKFSSNTIKKWFLNYRKGGFDALIPKSRNDMGKPRALDSFCIEKIHALKEKYPYITGKLLFCLPHNETESAIPYIDDFGANYLIKSSLLSSCLRFAAYVTIYHARLGT